jgi:hypothetical protein
MTIRPVANYFTNWTNNNNDCNNNNNNTYYDQVKGYEMGRVCSINVGEEECISDIAGKARRKETTRKIKT